MGEQPQNEPPGTGRPRTGGAGTAEESPVTRRHLLAGAGALFAVSVGAVACGGSGDTKRAAGRSPAAAKNPPPLRTPPPVAIPEHPKLRPLGRLEVPGSGVDAIRFNPDGTTLAACHGGVLWLWDVAGRKRLATSGTTSKVEVVHLAFSPDGRTLVTGSQDRAQFWDAATLRKLGGDLTRAGKAPFWDFQAVAFSPDGRFLAGGGSGDNGIHFYDPVTHRPTGITLPSDDASPGTLVFSPDGRLLANMNLGGAVRIWDVRARKRRDVRVQGQDEGPEPGGNGPEQNLAFSPDGRTLAVGNGADEVGFVAAATGEQHGKPLGGHTGFVTGLAYSTDGRTVVTSDDAGLNFWDATSHEKRATAAIPGTPPTVRHLGGGTITSPGTRSIIKFALSPDGRTVATVSDGTRTLALWRLE